MKKLIAIIFSAGMLAGVVSAQEVKARQVNQQKRIAQGVKSGALTPVETVNVEKKEAAIHQEVRADRALNGGRLTPAEKKTVNKQQNQMSKKIYQAKHN
jgi:hypothetical protein